MTDDDMMTSSLTRIFLLLLAVVLAGCSVFNEENDPTKNWSASKLYSEAKAELMDGNYEKAAKLYEALESRYPYGTYSQQAQLEQIYAYYKQGETTSAISEADRFIKAHPNHPGVDYAYYMKGLANFKDDLGLLGIYDSRDLSERDIKPTREAFDTFKELVTRFPNSRYAEDATARMGYLVNAMAMGDVATARYYYRRQAYLAAVNRAQEVVKTYPQAPAVEEALFIMYKSYDAMGIAGLRDDTLRVIQKDFPDSKFLKGSIRIERPWWRLFW
jgi:outer membrane protein assembly factor BamD